MHYSAVALAVATLTVGGQAFLIPPNMNKALNDDDFKLLEYTAPQNLDSEVLVMECNGCRKDGSDGALEFDLSVDNVGTTPKFLVNGADLTPIDLYSESFNNVFEINMPPPFFSVPLYPYESDTRIMMVNSETTEVVQVMYDSYSEIQQAEDGEVIKLYLEPTFVDGRAIPHGRKLVTVLVKAKSGKMYIQSAKVSDSQDQIMDLSLDGEKCGIFCEVLQKIAGWGKKAEEKMDKWGKKLGGKFRPCGKHSKIEAGSTKEGSTVTGGNAPEPKTEAKEEEETISIMPIIPIPPASDRVPTSPWRMPPHSRPHHRPHHPDGVEGHRSGRPWNHHHHHHHRPHHMTHGSGAASAVYRIFVQVLVPIAIGVVAGMLVSLMGMVVGHFAVLAYQKAVGAVRRARSAPMAEEGDEEEVSKGLLAGQGLDDAPPEYEEETALEAGDEKQ